ncbi:MAG: tetratricopeptide repeat protein [Nitrospiraceae bacterium]|nr:MAG: tetratricopeptide repeat protein [Nitrospiraceae bacterium]
MHLWSRDIKKLIVLAGLSFSLVSCAGLLFTDAASQFEKGIAFFNQGNYEEAIPHFRKATELDPNFGKAYLYLGRSYLNLRKWVDAVPPLRTAFRLAPEETRKEAFNILIDALLGAAAAKFKTGNFFDSIQYLKEGLSLQPESTQIKDDLIKNLKGYGGQLVSKGNYRDAISAFSEAIELSPGNTDALLGLAQAFLKSGDLRSSLQTVQKIIAIDSDNKAANSLFKELTGGR